MVLSLALTLPSLKLMFHALAGFGPSLEAEQKLDASAPVLVGRGNDRDIDPVATGIRPTRHPARR